MIYCICTVKPCRKRASCQFPAEFHDQQPCQILLMSCLWALTQLEKRHSTVKKLYVFPITDIKSCRPRRANLEDILTTACRMDSFSENILTQMSPHATRMIHIFLIQWQDSVLQLHRKSTAACDTFRLIYNEPGYQLVGRFRANLVRPKLQMGLCTFPTQSMPQSHFPTHALGSSHTLLLINLVSNGVNAQATTPGSKWLEARRMLSWTCRLRLLFHTLGSLGQPMSWISEHDAYLGFGGVSDSQKNHLVEAWWEDFEKQVCYLRSGRNNDW